MKKIFPIILVAGVGVAIYFFMKKKQIQKQKQNKMLNQKPKFGKELFNKVLNFAVENKGLIKTKT